MLRIKRLSRPTKRSGFALKPKGSTEIRGLVIVNDNNFTVYVDKFKDKARKKK